MFHEFYDSKFDIWTRIPTILFVSMKILYSMMTICHAVVKERDYGIWFYVVLLRKKLPVQSPSFSFLKLIQGKFSV